MPGIATLAPGPARCSLGLLAVRRAGAAAGKGRGWRDFVDVPRVGNLNLHPRLFFYPNAHSQMALGYTGTLESRRAGDIVELQKGFNPVSGHVFFIDNTSLRNTADLL